ncbi:GNAT family N-acetyltransferase [Streptacidiphilus jiangxiensis]|uniref:Acetyltransferase involved in cellulose biosynthesis, CelD/BcsL family n=1 Tax=Streptacidiphilus jiangxiensis TaxID=235985 RepID=A0A1H7VQF7_STRJI|nr:GNAT family N-acetyltransferase [Streptacidiphilus jiangxiensis]SEM11503.1 Acetyltransferase involved in cellulose biosynthesis, CelD/BcsL family [Streptacidiphilus jiangxiensis]
MTTAVRSDAAGPVDAAPRYETVVLRDERALEALAGEWNALQEQSPGATPFQCHAWLASWWHSYGRPGRLRLVTVRRDGRLIALAPFYRDGAALRPLGAEITDFHDVLLDAEYAEEGAARLAAALAAELRGPFARLDLPEVRGDAAIHRLFAHWPRAARKLPASLVQHLPGVPMDELLTRLPGRTAQRTKVKLRKLAAAGVDVRLVPPWEAPEAVDRMLALHALQWRERGATPEHMRERFASHLRAAATGMAATERAQLREYRLDGRLIACDLMLQSHAMVALYVYGVHPEARERVDIAGMLFGESLAHAVSTGRTELSLLRGDEPYKQRWRPDPSHNERLLLGSAPAVAVTAYLAGAEERAKEFARRRMPWVKELRGRVRVLKSKL